MAKITRPGVKAGWWIGRTAECTACGTQFEIEKNDIVWEKEKYEQQFGRVTEVIAFMDCPNPACQRPVGLLMPEIIVEGDSVSLSPTPASPTKSETGVLLP